MCLDVMFQKVCKGFWMVVGGVELVLYQARGCKNRVNLKVKICAFSANLAMIGGLRYRNKQEKKHRQ